MDFEPETNAWVKGLGLTDIDRTRGFQYMEVLGREASSVPAPGAMDLDWLTYFVLFGKMM
jgi:hypothetical protein